MLRQRSSDIMEQDNLVKKKKKPKTKGQTTKNLKCNYSPEKGRRNQIAIRKRKPSTKKLE
jgi:hypothetical protein